MTSPDTAIDPKSALAVQHGNRDWAGARMSDSQISADCRGKKIGILIVAYNAVTTLTQVLKRISPEVWSNVEEVVVFDDHSKDDTFALGVGFKALTGITKLTILRNEKNLGYGGNQKAGYKYLMDKGFDVAVLLHGDGQYAPEILSEMYAPIVKGDADAVFGSRMMKKYGGPLKGGMPFYKLLGNKILTHFENRSLGMKLSEFHSGYRAYNLDALKRIDWSKMTDDFHFDSEIIIKLNHQGYRIFETPIPTYYGNEICYVNGMKYAKDVFRAVRRYKKTVRGVSQFAEYAEYMPHYPLKESRGSSHSIMEELTGGNQTVLDIGCGEGHFSEILARKGNRVTGIDVIESPARKSALERYIQVRGDTGLNVALGELRGQRFERILLQDVLEHLPNPESTLTACRELLSPSGLILVSVPNVANITVRLALLFGRWEYTQRGILDKTHLRFYTRRSAKRLLEDSSYQIMRAKMSVMPIEIALGRSPHGLGMRMLNGILRAFTRAFPGLLGYQSIYSARLASPRKP